MDDPASPVAGAAAYLEAVRAGDDVAAHREWLGDLDREALVAALTTDREKLAFWLNVYNAAVQVLLTEDPSRFDSRWRFFRRDLLRVAGEDLSLNDVEHGMLRSSKLSWGMGYLPRLFPDDFERRGRVEVLDPRVHFALNCGAKSCPPIQSYTAEAIDAELDTATRSYLESEATFDPDRDVVEVPRLFFWYRGDFGGKAETLDFLHRHGAVPPGRNPRISYASYDWSLALGRFRERADAENR